MKATRSTREHVLTLLRAAVIGLCGGLASLAFRGATNSIQELIGLTDNILEGARTLEWWQLLLVPTCGALAAALVHRFLVKGSGGTGLSDVMEAVSLKSGPISLRSALSRAASSLGIIATGGSVGREGPIITISSAMSSWLTGALRAPARDRGLLLGCGVAAGFASAYNAPIAGALFAMEVVLANFAIDLLAPVVVASVTSTLFTWYAKGGDAPIYEIPQFHFKTLMELVPYLALGVACGAVAVGFQRLLTLTDRGFTAMPGPRWVKTAFGGVLIGAIAIWFPEVWGNGYESVSELMNPSQENVYGRLPWSELALLLITLGVVKAVGTAITVGSGGAGGVFTPTLFIGAGVGGSLGVLVHHFAPHAAGDYGGYALVGMGCMVAGTTRAPIMAILVIYELTRNYDIVLPLMLGCIVASLVAEALYPESIYTEKLRARGVHQPVGLEETVLVTTGVGDVMRSEPLTWVERGMTYGEIIPLATASRASVVYVCDEDRRLTGVIRVHDLIELASLGDLGPGILATDLAGKVESVSAEQRLAEVFDIYERSDLDELPVVDETGRLTGVVTRRDVMAALHLEVLKRQNLRAKFVHREDQQQATDYVELPKGVELARVPVRPEHIGRTLGDCQVRVEHHVTIVSVVRRDENGGEMRILPDGQFVMRAGDELIVLGDLDDLAEWRAAVERG